MRKSLIQHLEQRGVQVRLRYLRARRGLAQLSRHRSAADQLAPWAGHPQSLGVFTVNGANDIVSSSGYATGT